MPVKPRTSAERNAPISIDALRETVPALRQMPPREVKALKQKPYSLCLEQLEDVLQDDEQITSLTCAVSSSRGRGVLVLTNHRLVLITLRSGTCDWALSEIDRVRGRAARFTVPAAIYLDTAGRALVIVVGAGRIWGPRFTEAVHTAHARQPQAKAA